jgi:cytochrome c oxidase subunit 2
MDTQFQLLPDQASTMAPRIDMLFWFITAVCAFFIVAIAVMLITFAVRYRRRTEDYFPTPLVGSTPIEIVWTVIPLCLVMIMFVWGVRLYFDYVRAPDNALEVYVVGKQWMWHLQHPGGQREINALHIPVGRPVKLIMTSEDVIHDFYVPAFRVKMDAVPGKYTNLWFEATKAGTYNFFCALYCGTDHSRMIGKVVAMEPAEYEAWLNSNRADRSLALQGRQLFQKLQCVTCHRAEANNRAPILEGLYGRRVELEGGGSAVADESYIRESILYPARKVRAGWRPIMPTFKGQVSEDDLVRLVAFIKGMKLGDTPSRVEHATPPPEEKAAEGKKPDEGKKPESDKKKTDEKPKDEKKKDEKKKANGK